MNALISAAIPILRKQAMKLAKKIANDDQPDAGLWVGNYTATKLGTADKRFLGIKLYSDDIYRIDLDPADPLRFIHADSGIQYRPAMSFACDFGSTPWFLRNQTHIRLDPDAFRKSTLMHDSGYLHAACWVRKEDSQPWVKIPLTRVECDILLFWGMSAEVPDHRVKHEPTRLECQAYYRAVRAGGRTPWRRHRDRENQLLARK